MDCPRCDGSMDVKKIENVEIDECPKCKGIWFDPDELRNAKDQTDPDLNWMDFEIWKHEDRFKFGKNPIKCPKCNAEMAAIQYDKTAVEIDYCTQCQGAWLDEDEFEKIYRQLQGE